MFISRLFLAFAGYVRYESAALSKLSLSGVMACAVLVPVLRTAMVQHVMLFFVFKMFLRANSPSNFGDRLPGLSELAWTLSAILISTGGRNRNYA